MISKFKGIAVSLLCSGFAFAQSQFDLPLSSGQNDAEELAVDNLAASLLAGDLDVASSDLEMADDSTWNGNGQLVGLRWMLDLPQGFPIDSAFIEFVAKDNQSGPSALKIDIEDADDAGAISNTNKNISSRTLTGSPLDWTPGAWESGLVYRTPDLKDLISTVINRQNWKDGNHIAFVISGTGTRNARSGDNSENLVPRLKIYLPTDVTYQPVLVNPIADFELAAGWDFNLDLSPYFSDKDSELSFNAYAAGDSVLPAWLNLQDGVLSGTNNTVEQVDIVVEAISEGDTLKETFSIDFIDEEGDFTLAIFHNNDGESHFLADTVLYNGQQVLAGAVSQFKATLDDKRAQAEARGYSSIMLSSGDNFLAGLEHNASVANGVSYDAIALDSMGYDAICLGNHDFDFGTQVLADMINSFSTTQPPYLSSNLGFDSVPEMKALVDSGRVKKSTIITKNSEKIGVIGLTTPLLPTISSPGKTMVSDSIVAAVNEEIDSLKANGVNKIILISHLQSIEEDKALAALLDDVDVMIAGGGDELLSNNPALGAPYNITPAGTYPIVVKDKSGDDVYIVTTPGGYRYLGNLLVSFDAQGNVVKVYQSEVELVLGPSNAGLVASVEEPIETFIGDLAITVVADVQDTLDFLRETLRGKESNGGNLFADAILYQGKKSASQFGAKIPQIAIQNSGGLRIESIIPTGTMTEDKTYKIAAFDNTVSVVEDITPTKLKELMEHGVASAPQLDGRFPQIAGFKIVYDPTAEPGSRVKSIELDDGTVIVEDGLIAANAPDVTMATIDFTAKGGDGYPFAPYTPIILGTSYQQAFLNFLTSADGLDGEITKGLYPLGMNERIIEELGEIPAINGVILAEDFNGCEDAMPSDWIMHSVTSNADWECTSDTRGESGEDGDYAVEANGYGADTLSNDWLISPYVELDGPALLSFSTDVRYGGPALEVLWSEDYSGQGDPSSATWVAVAGTSLDEDDGGYGYHQAKDVDLSELGSGYLAFHYTSTGTTGGTGAVWRVDNVVIKNEALFAENFDAHCGDDEELAFAEYDDNDIFNCSSNGSTADVDNYAFEGNGYGVSAGDGWLVTPKLALGEGEFTLEFASREQYNGPDAEILYSTDYSGVGDPAVATWMPIQKAIDAVGGSSMTESGLIELSMITEDAYLAVHYKSNGTAGGDSKRFGIDDFKVAAKKAEQNFGELPIFAIQGDAEESPYANGLVTTYGIVTKVFKGKAFTGASFDADMVGYYIQDATGDADANTSDGLFVYDTTTVAVGDSIVIEGKVEEKFGQTQITPTSVEIKASNKTLPAAVSLSFPVNSWEALEGMLVKANGLVVTENRSLHYYGELRLSAGALLRQPTQDIDPADTLAVSELLEKNAMSSFILDDNRSGSLPAVVPFLGGASTLIAGTEVDSIYGVLAYGFSKYRVHPIAAPVFNYAEREEKPEFADSLITVATFNVLNYFNGDGLGGGFPTSRGASSAADFEKQSQKIVAALEDLNADVYGLMEIENDDGDDSTSAVRQLVKELNAALGSDVYDFVKTNAIKRSDDSMDEIKVAILYNKERVTPKGNYAILNNDFSEDFHDDKNRPVLAQSFEVISSEEVFTVAVNHLKSKGSSCDDLGDADLNDGQGNCAKTRAKAAAVLADWLESDPTQSESSNFLIIGDLNSYGKEDAIDTLLTLGYQSVESEGAYSYVYDGQYGTLDYIMVNDSLVSLVAGAQTWHINSLEPDMNRYDGVASYFVADAYGSSDHDPVIVALDLGSEETSSIFEFNKGLVIDNEQLIFNQDVRGVLYDLQGKARVHFKGDQVSLKNLEAGIYFVRTDKIGSFKISIK